MKHKYDLYFALILLLLIVALLTIIGMRKGAADMRTLTDRQMSNLSAAYEAQIAELQTAIDELRTADRVIIEETYTPLPVDYETAIDVDESYAALIAKVIWGEYRSDKSNYNQMAAVAWSVLNRVDAGYGDIETVCTGGAYHGYDDRNPVDMDILAVAVDVLTRWQLEALGANTDVGRVLPKDYLWFSSDGSGKNTYRNAYTGGERMTP